MRWSGQAVSAESTAALPGLGSLRGLVKSVQTPEFAGITFHEVLAKSALNHVPGSSSALPFAWTINPYRGCSHACTFCFARNTHTYLDLDAGKDFDSEIVVKVNVAEVLAKELARPSWERHPVALGTNTDPYQRAEGRYRLMPGIIAALAASATPFSILTKGTLLRRDIPLLQAAAQHVPIEIAMTIDVLDSDLRASVEPGAPTTEARLATVRAVRDAGLPCSVFVMPVLPYLTDSSDHLDRLFSAIAEAGAESVAYSALHLRTGAREWFFAWLAREHPELLARYGAMYPGRQAYAPAEYRTWLAARVRPLLRKHGLARPPRIDPATGSPLPRVIGRTRARGNVGDRMLANELPAAAAAGLQPTLF
jgi:DNA repair photolyase